MKPGFPRVAVDIDLGDGPISTHFRLTNYAMACFREEVGQKAFEAFGNAEKMKALTGKERIVLDAVTIWALLLHAHDGITVKQVLDNLPVDRDDYNAISAKVVEAFTRGQPPARPTNGSRRAAQQTAATGGTQKPNGVPTPAPNSESAQMSILS